MPEIVKHAHAVNRVYGWKRSSRPSHFSLWSPPAHLMSAANLPGSVDLRPKCPAVYDQLSLGSCTANAIAGLFQFLQMKLGLVSWVPSRLMLYYGERKIEGDTADDSGAYGDDGFTVLEDTGICPETEWPYDVGQFAANPPAKAWTDALPNKITGPVTIADGNIQGIKSCLASGYPVAFGFNVYPEIESDAVGNSGILPDPTGKEQSIGGHETLIVGYDDAANHLGETGWFLVRNSWGPGWGLAGYYWQSYKYISNTAECSDFRSATGVTSAVLPTPTPTPTPTPPSPGTIPEITMAGDGWMVTVNPAASPVDIAFSPANANVFPIGSAAHQEASVSLAIPSWLKNFLPLIIAYLQSLATSPTAKKSLMVMLVVGGLLSPMCFGQIPAGQTRAPLPPSSYSNITAAPPPITRRENVMAPPTSAIVDPTDLASQAALKWLDALPARVKKLEAAYDALAALHAASMAAPRPGISEEAYPSFHKRMIDAENTITAFEAKVATKP